ncbi:MAG: glycosyltransferase family 9 protein [Pseudomonadota bacterium]
MSRNLGGGWTTAAGELAWRGLCALAARRVGMSAASSRGDAPTRIADVRRISLFAAISNRDNPHVPGLGDLISKNAFLKVLRDSYPSARLSCVAGPRLLRRYGDFMLRHGYIDELVECPEPGASDAWRWIAFVRRMRRERFDLCVIDPSSVELRAIQAYLCGIPERVGVPFHADEARFLSRVVALDFASAERFPDLLDSTRAFSAAIGVPRAPQPSDLVPRFPYARGETDDPTSSTLVAVHIGGDAHWNRRWPPERYRELCARLCRLRGVGVRLVGGDGESADNRALRDAVLSADPAADIVDVSGGTLDAMANRIDRTALFIGNDSAPMHIAAALGKPVIVPCGPIGSALWERLYAARIVRLDYACHEPSGFSSQRHLRRDFSCEEFRCPYGFDPAAPTYPRCLAEISVDRVWEAVEDWRATQPAAPAGAGPDRAASGALPE